MGSETNPYEAGSPVQGEASVTRASARDQLLPVAIALLVTSILHIVSGFFYFVFIYSQVAAPDADPWETHMSVVYCMYYGVTMLYCLLLAVGAFSMMRRDSYIWAMTVCILAVVPLLGPCYILAIPLGIWGIVVLSRPDVRESFRRT